MLWVLKEDGHNGLWDSIHVFLDPSSKDGRTLLEVIHCRPDEPVAAVLLHNGVPESRTSPPSGAFQQESLARITRQALDFVGAKR